MRPDTAADARRATQNPSGTGRVDGELSLGRSRRLANFGQSDLTDWYRSPADFGHPVGNYACVLTMAPMEPTPCMFCDKVCRKPVRVA